MRLALNLTPVVAQFGRFMPMLPPEDATGLRAKYSVIYDEEEKAREEAWYIYLSQHAHDFSGSQGQTGLVSLAQLGIEIVISMVQSGHSDRDYLELLVQAGCPVSACKGGSMGESRWLQGASHWRVASSWWLAGWLAGVGTALPCNSDPAHAASILCFPCLFPSPLFLHADPC